MVNSETNIVDDNRIYNKGCVDFGIPFVFFINGSTMSLGSIFKVLNIHLPNLILAIWFVIWFVTTIIAVHIFVFLQSKGLLRLFYLISLWFLQSFFIGAVVYGNISKDPYVQYSYIAAFSCIILIAYCIFFSPILFVKLHINPRSNALFRILNDLNRSFDKTRDEERKEEVDTEELIGVIGVSETILRPTGRGRFSGRLIHITTRGEFIAAKSPIKIVEKSGSLYIVEMYEEDNA